MLMTLHSLSNSLLCATNCLFTHGLQGLPFWSTVERHDVDFRVKINFDVSRYKLKYYQVYNALLERVFWTRRHNEFESFGAISSWSWTTAMDRLPISCGHWPRSLESHSTLESIGLFLWRPFVESSWTNSLRTKFFVDFQTKYGPCRQQTSSLPYKIVHSAEKSSCGVVIWSLHWTTSTARNWSKRFHCFTQIYSRCGRNKWNWFGRLWRHAMQFRREKLTSKSQPRNAKIAVENYRVGSSN